MIDAMVGVLEDRVASPFCQHEWLVDRAKDRRSRLRRGDNLQPKHADCLPGKTETLPCHESGPPRPASTMGISRHIASQAASTRAKSLSTHVKTTLALSSSPYPTSAISLSQDLHCVPGNAEVRETHKVAAFGRPQSLARKNTDREMFEISTLSGSTTTTCLAPNKPRFF